MNNHLRKRLLSVATAAMMGIGSIASAEGMPILPVPVDPAEYQAACRHEPFLQRLSMQNAFGYEGMGTLLLADDELPILPRPHVPWARPLPGGPLKIGYFVSHNGHGMGDMAEVARRLDCKLYTVEVVTAPLFEFYSADHPLGWQARKALKTLERDLDVIVLAGGAQYLTADVQAKILEKVKAGCGLYMADIRRFATSIKAFPEDAPFLELMPFAGQQKSHADAEQGAPAAFLKPEIISAMPFATTFSRTRYAITPIKPGWEVVATHGEQPVWYAGQVGLGRVVAANFQANLFPQTPRERLSFSSEYQEYLGAGFAKIMRWLGGRATPVRVDIRVPEDAPAGQPFAFALALQAMDGAPDTVDVSGTVRDLNFRVLGSSEDRFKLTPGGETTVSLALPALPAGQLCVVEVIARNRAGEALDWGQELVATMAPENLAVTTDREIYRPGETVRLSAQLANRQPNTDYKADLLVWDETGRELVRSEHTFAGHQLSLDIPIGPLVTAPHHARIILSRDGQAVRVAEALYYVPRFGWDEWQSGLWPSWWTQQYQSEQQHRTLMEWIGLTASSEMWGREPHILSKLGLGILRVNDATLDPRQVYDDPAKAGEVSERVLGQALDWTERYGCVAWNFQDERHLGSEPAYGEAAVAAFRVWLKDIYNHDIAALNANWGAAFGGFEEIVPMKAEELPTSPAHLGGWLDTRLFIRDQVAAIDQRNADRVHERLPAPQAIGIDAFMDMSHHAYSGTDWGHMLARYFNTHYPYTGEKLTSFSMLKGLAPDNTPFPVQAGEKMFPRRVYYAQSWQQTLAGGTGGVLGLSRFYGKTFVHEYGYMYPSAKWIAETDGPLLKGIGKMLLQADRVEDPVVFLYSYESMMANLALGKLIDPHNRHLLHRPASWSLFSLQTLIADHGLTADWLTAEQVAAGGLDGRKMLIIGDYMGVALSDETCAAIASFVENGGTVVADLCPALFTERGRLRDKGGLDHVFGVSHGELAFARRPSDWLVNGFKQRDHRLQIQHWFIGEYFETSLQVEGGKQLGEHIFLEEPKPAMVLNLYGQGNAFLLNFLETQYYRHPYDGPFELMGGLLQLAGVEPDVTVSDPNGAIRWGYQTTRFRHGEQLHVGLYRRGDTPSYYLDETVVKLPERGHVYLVGGVKDAAAGEMMEPAYLGEAGTVRVGLKGMSAVLLSVLPYRPIELEFGLPRRANRGEVVRARLTLAAEQAVGDHVVHVEVRRPDGSRHPHYSANVALKDGVGEFVLPVALNDANGRWQLIAREAISGLTTTQELRIR